jgi:hypothetical protein
MKMTRPWLFLLVLAGAWWAILPGDAIAKCALAEYVVTGSLDLPQEVKRVGMSVFLDDQRTSSLVQFEAPVVHFELSVLFNTLASQIVIFSHDCSRKPRHLELVVTDGERMTFRIRLPKKDFSIEEQAWPLYRIDLGHIRLRVPS